MNSKQRVLCALKLGTPDRVPYMYNLIEKSLQEKIIQKTISVKTVDAMNAWGCIATPGDETTVEPVFTVAPETASLLKLDAIGVQVLPPIFAGSHLSDERQVITDGLLTSFEALKKAKMPDPDDERIYRKVEKLIEGIKDEYAIYARIRLGASPTLLSMGMEGFSYSLFDEPELVEAVLKLYTDWSCRVSKNLCELDIDFLWCFDDIAFKSSPMFSKDVFCNIFKSHLMTASSEISKPWVFHSDGNLVPLLDELLDLGMNGLHPLEPGAMDLDELKNKYGNRVCLIGNIDIDKTLSRGTPDDVYREVGERINQLGPGGGFIISDSNSVPSYCKAENIIAMSKAVQELGYIY